MTLANFAIKNARQHAVAGLPASCRCPMISAGEKFMNKIHNGMMIYDLY